MDLPIQNLHLSWGVPSRPARWPNMRPVPTTTRYQHIPGLVNIQKTMENPIKSPFFMGKLPISMAI